MGECQRHGSSEQVTRDLLKAADKAEAQLRYVLKGQSARPVTKSVQAELREAIDNFRAHTDAQQAELVRDVQADMLTRANDE